MPCHHSAAPPIGRGRANGTTRSSEDGQRSEEADGYRPAAPCRRRRRPTPLLPLLATLVVLVAVSLSAPLRVQSEDVDAALHELRSLAATLRADVDRLETSLTTINGVVAAQQTKLSAAHATIAAQQGELTRAHAALATHADQIAALQAADTDMAAASVELAWRLSAAENLSANNPLVTRVMAVDMQTIVHASQIQDLRAEDAGIRAHTTQLLTRAGNAESAAATLTTRVTNAESAALTLSATVGDHTTQIGDLKSADTAIRSDATALAGRVTHAENAATALATRVKDAEDLTGAKLLVTTVKGHTGDITALQSADTAIQSAATALTARVTAAEDLTGTKPLVTRVKAVESLAGTHSSQIADLQTADGAIQSAAATLTTRVDGAIADTTALTLRVKAAEDLTGTKLLVTTVKGHSTQITALQGEDSAIKSSATALSTRVTQAETLVVDSSALVTTVLAHSDRLNTLALTVTNFKSPIMYRFSFTTSQSWTVPAGVRSAFVTMAGGGGSGYGWRIINGQQTGHSGGFVMSHPVKLVGGETVQVTVGAGGISFGPVDGGPVPGKEYYRLFLKNPNDDGLGGYPGGHSAITSPSLGELLRCDGGSGANPGRIDTLDGGTLVAGNLGGATIGSQVGTNLAPNRPAVGPYAAERAPGACGPNKFGIGNPGAQTYLPNSGDSSGGLTPLGYGSGGSITRQGCYVTATLIGSCIIPSSGRDGVVYIDVMY